MDNKIIQIELPEDSEYQLTKIEALDKEVFTFVEVGRRCTLYRGFKSGISTSLVKEIRLVPNNPRKLIIHTENSIYELEEVDD